MRDSNSNRRWTESSRRVHSSSFFFFSFRGRSYRRPERRSEWPSFVSGLVRPCHTYENLLPPPIAPLALPSSLPPRIWSSGERVSTLSRSHSVSSHLNHASLVFNVRTTLSVFLTLRISMRRRLTNVRHNTRTDRFKA